MSRSIEIIKMFESTLSTEVALSAKKRITEISKLRSIYKKATDMKAKISELDKEEKMLKKFLKDYEVFSKLS